MLREIVVWYVAGFLVTALIGVVINLLPRARHVPPLGYWFVFYAALLWPLTAIALVAMALVFILFGA